jgi:hypothetical protein
MLPKEMFYRDQTCPIIVTIGDLGKRLLESSVLFASSIKFFGHIRYKLSFKAKFICHKMAISVSSFG